MMTGLNLRISVLGSISPGSEGATYTVIYTESTATGFGGSGEVTVGPLPVPRMDADGAWFNFYEIKADWLGNLLTTPGSATSQPYDVVGG